MLILVAGITGFVGLPCAEAALARGHQVRGLARNIDRVPANIREQLEGLHTMSDIYDSAAMDRAVTGVDAIVSAIAAVPEMLIDAQLMLLRAAERAGVKIFHATSWNADWRLAPGSHELYDELRAFAHHVELSSSIKPLYMITGAIAEYIFCRSPRDWDPKTKTFHFHGDSEFAMRYTTAGDIANYVLEAITAPDAANGGFICVQSFEASPKDVVETYNRVREGRVQASYKYWGTLEEAKAKLDAGRATYSKKDMYQYMWYVYQYHLPMRSWDYEPVDVARFYNVKQTTLEEFFRQNPDV
ncbi:NmrA-like family protein, partial [Macrophomina phaseolina]